MAIPQMKQLEIQIIHHSTFLQHLQKMKGEKENYHGTYQRARLNHQRKLLHRIKYKSDVTRQELCNKAATSLENGEDLDEQTLTHGQAVIYCPKDGKTHDVTIWEKTPAPVKKSKPNVKTTKKGDAMTRTNSAALAKRTSGVMDIDTQALVDDASSILEDVDKRNRSTPLNNSLMIVPSLESNIRIENVYELLIKMDRKLNDLHDTLAKIVDSKDINEVNKDNPKYCKNGIYLLKIEAKDSNAYGRNLLDVLITKSEQKNGILLQSKKSTKPALDPERVQLLFGMFFKSICKN
uniref:Uncharacterized protein n=1 Tax=Amphimedon queenslandica TaxID=400682 RepID=A0A1X7UPM5_AMPQE